jgi:hypothetical protein
MRTHGQRRHRHGHEHEHGDGGGRVTTGRRPPAAGARGGRRWALLAGLVTAGLLVAAVPGEEALTQAVAGAREAAGALRAAGPPGVAGDGRVGEARLTVDDVDHPAVAGLDPALLDAVRAATEDARRDGVELLITSGWRSRDYQQRLLDEAVQRRGSREEALRWVLPPDASRHVDGEAVDIGPTEASYWMAEHGARHGLCQVYANEVWHYELLAAPGGTCPALRADSAS